MPDLNHIKVDHDKPASTLHVRLTLCVGIWRLNASIKSPPALKLCFKIYIEGCYIDSKMYIGIRGLSKYIRPNIDISYSNIQAKNIKFASLINRTL